jgi:PAS domain S-box-containing protein
VALLDGPNSIALVVDLTEQRKAQELVRHLREERTANALFRELLEAAPDAMVIADDRGLIALVNAQALKLFGYAREEMIGQPAAMLVPQRALAEHRSRWQRYYGDARLRRMGEAMELVGLRKDGTELDIEVRHSPLQTDRGVLVSSSIRDITERQRAENTLRVSEERFRLLVASVKDYAILMLDPEGRVTTWNEGAERIKGWTAEEIIGQPLTRFYPADAQELPAEELRIAERDGRVEDEGWRVRKDGSRFWANVVITAVHDARGTMVGFAKVTRDLSERRRAEQALLHVNRELEAFSYSVAHDLRAPLRGMSGFAQLLLDTQHDQLDAEGKEWLGLILDNARRMGALIDALLSLARVTRSNLSRHRVDLSAVVRAAAAELATAEPARSVEIVVPEHAWVDADPSLVRALVQNLVGNAWKFTSRAPAARIELGVAEGGGPDAFFVRDNGAGFDMAYASKLFGAFQRLHKESEFSGTGIGLATVQRIVHRHGGRVWAEGVVDHGATLFFTLPATSPAGEHGHTSVSAR